MSNTRKLNLRLAGAFFLAVSAVGVGCKELPFYGLSDKVAPELGISGVMGRAVDAKLRDGGFEKFNFSRGHGCPTVWN